MLIPQRYEGEKKGKKKKGKRQCAFLGSPHRQNEKGEVGATKKGKKKGETDRTLSDLIIKLEKKKKRKSGRAAFPPCNSSN